MNCLLLLHPRKVEVTVSLAFSATIQMERHGQLLIAAFCPFTVLIVSQFLVASTKQPSLIYRHDPVKVKAPISLVHINGRNCSTFLFLSHLNSYWLVYAL